MPAKVVIAVRAVHMSTATVFLDWRIATRTAFQSAHIELLTNVRLSHLICLFTLALILRACALVVTDVACRNASAFPFRRYNVRGSNLETYLGPIRESKEHSKSIHS